MYGRYPLEELWRVNLTYALALAGLIPLMLPGVPGKLWLSIYTLVVFPIIAYFLLTGAEWLGLPATLLFSTEKSYGKKVEFHSLNNQFHFIVKKNATVNF